MHITKEKSLQAFHIMLDNAKMKFNPLSLAQQTRSRSKSLMGKLFSVFQGTSQNRQIGNQKFNRLKYLEKLSSQWILIGNQYQIDMISISGKNKKYVDTQYLWSLLNKSPIQHICIDTKKCFLVLVSKKEIHIYKYDVKNIELKPVLFKTILTKQPVLFIQFPKESLLACFYQNMLEVYAINQQGVRLRYSYKYQITDNLKIYQVPPAYQQIVNIFFTQQKPNMDTFSLWCIELQFLPMQIKMQTAHKVYDIKDSLKNTLVMNNYSKEIFLMNTGSQIFPVKKGYIIDSANVNLRHENSVLKYVGNDRLLHITDKKIEVYNFFIDRNAKRQKITLKSIDSIKIYKPQNGLYFGAMEVIGNNFVVLYQIDPRLNNRSNGQIIYWVSMTTPISLQQKINKIFPKQKMQFFKLNPNILAQKCDVATKMGLTDKQIFLQLWNRTQQKTQKDYQLLLTTKDYQSIKQQIQKKLKKASISYKQIQSIQKQCFKMLQQTLFGSNCTQSTIKDYISSHFFLRKLQLFKQIQMEQRKIKNISQKTPQKIMINIQQYYTIKRTDVKNYIVQLVNAFCHEKKNTITQIRFVLRYFKFIFRMIYQELLSQIIITAKKQLLRLLMEIPQLLPCKIHDISLQDQWLYQGIWSDISKNQWESSLYIQALTTIDNRSLIQQFVNTVWYKMNKLSKHDLIAKNKQQIIEKHNLNNSSYIFFYFIAKIFEVFPLANDNDTLEDHTNHNEFYISNPVRYKANNDFTILRKNPVTLFEIPKNKKIQSTHFIDINEKSIDPKQLNKKILKSLIDQLQIRYSRMPNYLKGKIFLYYKLYKYLAENHILPQNKTNFNEFLELQDPQMFRHFFKRQRNQKGLILKVIKPIYEKIGPKGSEMFNNSLFNYFSSDLSQVSDLKYILNRINNQKIQFHKQNKPMYKILIRAMLMKLKIGSDNDIPIDQVIIYIENIHILKQDNIANDIQFIQTIRVHADKFKKMKLNMSLDQINKNRQQVITKMTHYQIEDKKILEIKNQQQLLKTTYKALGNVLLLKEKLFKTDDYFLPFFVYLCKILEQTNRIQLGARLLKDPYLIDNFAVDNQTQQKLILYMYRWKFHQNPIYVQNQNYMNQLVKILPDGSQWRQYLQCQVKFAVMLSCKTSLVQYPLTLPGAAPTIQQFSQLISTLPAEHIFTIDEKKICNLMVTMKDILIEGNIPIANHDIQASTIITRAVSLHQIYQAIIIRLLQLGQLKALVRYLKKILQVKIQNSILNIVYPILYIEQIVKIKQLNIDCTDLLIKCIFYYFQQPIKLIEIIQQMQIHKLNNSQKKQYLTSKLQEGKQYSLGYHQNNDLFKPQLKKIMSDPQNQFDLNIIIDRVIDNLKQMKYQFNNNVIYTIFIKMLCCQPYVLGKYLQIKKQHINFKYVKSFLQYMANSQLFDKQAINQFALRIKSGIDRDIVISENYIQDFKQTQLSKQQQQKSLNKKQSKQTRKSKKKHKQFNAKLEMNRMMQKKQKIAFGSGNSGQYVQFPKSSSADMFLSTDFSKSLRVASSSNYHSLRNSSAITFGMDSSKQRRGMEGSKSKQDHMRLYIP